MALNRADIRTKIRETLRDFYDVDTVRTGGIDSSATTLPVDNPSRFNIGDKITVETEHMIVRDVNNEDSELTVTRAFQITTAAAHVAGVAIIIHPEFTDRALNQGVDAGIADTYPDIWIEVVDETLTTAVAREYTIPSGFTLVKRIQIANADGFFIEDRNWELIGTKIKFNRDHLDLARTIRVIGQTYQALLTDDTTNLTLQDEQAEFIIHKSALSALEMRLGHRLKATEYSASVNDRAGQPLELIQMYNYLRRQVQVLKARELRPQMSTFAMRPVR